MERLFGVVSLLVIESLRTEHIMLCSRNKKCITILLTSCISEWPKQLQFSSHNNFRTWFTVSENRRATQLAEQVIDHAQNKLNPLIIVGESGTGKSHLLNAIGQAAMVSNERSTYFVRANELPFACLKIIIGQIFFSQASMLIIDDIDHSLENDELANTWGNIIDLALNMNVHVIVSSTTMPQGWPAIKLWDLLRTGGKTISGCC